MKITPKQYAQSLLELVKGKPDSEVKNILSRFVILLNRNQDLNRVEMIIKNFELLYDDDNGIVKVELLSARPLSKEIVFKIKSYIEKRLNIDKVELSEVINQDLIGGFILRYNGLVIDGSLKNNLLKFKKQLLTN